MNQGVHFSVVIYTRWVASCQLRQPSKHNNFKGFLCFVDFTSPFSCFFNTPTTPFPSLHSHPLLRLVGSSFRSVHSVPHPVEFFLFHRGTQNRMNAPHLTCGLHENQCCCCGSTARRGGDKTPGSSAGWRPNYRRE